MRYIAPFLLLFIFQVQVFAQFGKDTDRWDFQEYNSFSKAAVKIESEGILGKAKGSGVIVEKTEEAHPDHPTMVKAYLITAAHVLAAAQKTTLSFQGGGSFQTNILGKVIMDQDSDTALLPVYVPKNYNSLEVATEGIEGEEAFVTGFGGPFLLDDRDKPRFWRTKLARVSKDKSIILLVTDVIAGDSGGPIFNSKGELLGVVSGGVSWCCDEDLKHPVTFPLRAGSFSKINELIQKQKEKESKVEDN